MDSAQEFTVFVWPSKWAQESVHWFVHHQDTCWLEARIDRRRFCGTGGYALFCCGEHFGFIGEIDKWPFKICKVEAVEYVTGKANDDPNGEEIVNFIRIRKSE